MSASPLDPKRIAHFVRLVGMGSSYNKAAKEAGISNATIFRHLKDPLSPISAGLARKGLIEAVAPELQQLSNEALRAYNDFGYFRARYFARATLPWAEEAAYKIVALVETEDKEYVVINEPPGVGKSTLFVHDLPVWLAVRNRTLRQMIGSSSQKLASGYTGQIRNTLERTSIVLADPELKKRGLAMDGAATLADDFGRFKPTSGELWRRDEFVLAQAKGATLTSKEASFVAFGMDTKFLGGRFNVVLWDDLVTNDSLRTEKSREDMIHDWETEAETRLEPNGLLILQGQRLAGNDLYRYCLDLKAYTEIDVEPEKAPKKYYHIKYKAHYEEECKGLHAKTDEPWKPDGKGGCLLDPYRLTWRDLMAVKANKEEQYQIVYQQEDVDSLSALVNREWIEGGTFNGKSYRGCWDEERLIGNWPRPVEGYSVLSVDPSPSRYWGILWFAFDPESKEQHIVDMARAPMSAPEFLDYSMSERKFTGLLEEWWLRSADQGHPITYLIFEENAAQRWLTQYDHFKRWASIRGVSLIKHQTSRNKSSEEYGVQALAPEYEFGRVRLPGKGHSKEVMNPMVKELTAWTPIYKGTTDLVMAHWFLLWNAPIHFTAFKGEPYRRKMPSFMEGRGRALVG